ncbi:MAG: NAD(P)-binding domain-containing protein [Synergistaceae bacterium]|nr:NAD(P)-binding domain-containing protein [Synergistaceae bacterium]
MDMTKKISIIGAGALGGAVARGLVAAGREVMASCPHPERRSEVRASGAEMTSDNVEAASWGDVVMFAVKPHLTLGVVTEAAPHIEGKLCVSLAAAVPLASLEGRAPKARWARAMTSICAAMGAAFTGLSLSGACTEEDRAWLFDAFGPLGDVEIVEEGKLDALTALTGAGPALFLELLEAAAMGGIHAGLPKVLAYRAAVAAVLGAARLAAGHEGRAASDVRDSICTPGGMTIEGVAEIERSGARGTMMMAVLRTAEKGARLTEALLKAL